MNENENKKYNGKQTENKKSHKLDIIALVLCLVAALSIWLFVVNSNKTTVDKTIIVTVDAAAQMKDDTGLSIIDGNDMIDYSQVKVTLKVTGTKSALAKYTDSDYKVKIKTDPIRDGGAGKYFISFEDPVLPGKDVALKSMEPAYINTLTLVDEMATGKKVSVTAGIGEGGLPSDCTLESIAPVVSETGENMKTVSISGPKSIIDTIDKVIVKVNLANYTKSTVIKSKTFEFMDRSGVSVKNDNNYITVEPSDVDVKLVIKYTDKPVSVAVKYTTKDSDVYKYDVKLAFTDSNKAELRLSGDSDLFSDKLEYDIGDITNQTSINITVDDLIRSGAIPQGLTVNSEDAVKMLVVNITKEKIVQDETGASSETTTAGQTTASTEGSP